jgi:dCMP deaminase
MRISRKQMFMGMAELAAKRSTCYRGNIGALIVHENSPVGLGYNGPPAGDEHCKGNSCEIHEVTKGCLRSVHAEVNALARMPNVTWPHHGCDMFVTSNPCPACAARIVDSGVIGRVYYQSPYRITTGIKELLNADIRVYRFSPSGYLVDEATGEVLEAS